MDLYYSFTADAIPEINEVGGKALSLILMSKANLPVPQGVVLTTSFFDVWFEKN
jgi:rifampicin phosphotransferase